MKTFLVIVVTALGSLSLVLAWMGVKTIGKGLGVYETDGAHADLNGIYLMLGLLQFVGSLVALFALYRFTKTGRLLSSRPPPAPTSSIRERALANLKAAQSSRS